MNVFDSLKDTQYSIAGAIEYLRKNGHCTYDQIKNINDILNQKVIKRRMRGREISSKLHSEFYSTLTIQRMCEMMSSASTQFINESLLNNEQFIRMMNHYENSQRKFSHVPVSKEHTEETQYEPGE